MVFDIFYYSFDGCKILLVISVFRLRREFIRIISIKIPCDNNIANCRSFTLYDLCQFSLFIVC